jgi:hypothetical protein
MIDGGAAFGYAWSIFGRAGSAKLLVFLWRDKELIGFVFAGVYVTYKVRSKVVSERIR